MAKKPKTSTRKKQATETTTQKPRSNSKSQSRSVAKSPANEAQSPIEVVEYLEEESNDMDFAEAQPAGSFPKIPRVLPVLPIRGAVMFPGTIVPIGVGRPTSLKLLDHWLPKNKLIALFTQKDESQEDPKQEQLYQVGTVGAVLKVIKQQDDSVSIILHGLRRVRFKRVTQQKPYMMAELGLVQETPGKGKAFEAEIDQLKGEAAELIDLSPAAPEQAKTVLLNIDESGNLCDFLAANLNIEVHRKQEMLEQRNVAQRLRLVHQEVARQLEIARLQQKIHQDVQNTIGDGQRKLFLREQIRAIQRELGDNDEAGSQTLDKLREKLKETNPPEKVMMEAERELKRLESVPPASPEYSLILTYLELVAELPWTKASQDHLDLEKAREILDRDHFDLEKVKRRLIEYLAVRKLNPDGRGPILCLVGPPGVGKTSLGQSVADAMGRPFARLALGGIRDEAEVRGHRRTYIGAMPGRIIQELRRAGANNPVMMLDEVDKLGSDFRGDPTSALLEVLDPRQNHAFVDRYLDVPFDLSNTLFICTANYVGNVPPALKDRLEIIDIPGYTDHDKATIARRYLVPRQLKENGLKTSQCRWRVDAIHRVIESYTRESGVRELERQIGSVCRSVAAEVAKTLPADGKSKKKKTKAKNKTKPHGYTIDADRVRQALGPEKYVRDLDMRVRVPGVAVGLAYTPTGGEILFIEATLYPGKGNIQLTGQIGDVMKESANASLSLFKTRAAQCGYDVRKLADYDLHIHVPSGAVPKDGPSAGIAMYTAIVSLLLDVPIKRQLAMTGELTLRGTVLPIGGVKEKSLAASRADIKYILLPEKNRTDLEEIDSKVRQRCKFIFVEHVDDVLKHALGNSLPKLIASKHENGLLESASK